MPEMKTLGGYEVVDAKAREDITGLRNDLPTKVSQLQNDSKFITRDEVPEQDLSEYITENELLAKGYLTEHQDLSEYAKKTDIPEVMPTDGIKAVFIDASSLTGNSSAIPEEYVSIFQKYASGEDRDVYFFIKLDGYTYYQPESIYIPSESMLALYLPISYHATNNPARLYSKSITIRLDYSPPSWWINTSYNQLVTKTYVDNAIAALEARVAALEGGIN